MNKKKNYILLIGIFLFMLIKPNNCWSNNAIHNDDMVRSSFSVIEPCQFVNDIDSITVLYWNASGCDYDQYTISYSSATGNLTVYVEYLKSIPAYPIICSEQSRLFLSFIDALYLKKSIPIVEKKIKQNTEEHVEYDIPTFHVEGYKNGKRVFFSSTLLEDGDYCIFFNYRFEEFKNMILSMVEEYDKYVKQTLNEKDYYRCRYY